MKIAFFVYPSAFQNKGGGEIVLEKRYEYLRRAGVDVDKFDMWSHRLENYDILHIFGSVKECLPLMEVARSRDTKVVIESIFWSDLRRSYLEAGGLRKKAVMLLKHITKAACPVFPSSRKKMFDTADLVIPNSESEAQQLSRYFSVPKKKMFVVPNGVDLEFSEASSEVFLEKYGVRDFVLMVGRIEPRKNQLSLIRSMKNSPYKLVVVGAPVSGYEWYHEKCLEEARGDVLFIDNVDHGSEILKSAYAACKVFALPTWLETPGLAALEAAIAGANIVITDIGCTGEYFGDKVEYVDPGKVNDIRSKINTAMEKPRSDDLKKYILGNYTWDVVVEKSLEGYKKILG